MLTENELARLRRLEEQVAALTNRVFRLEGASREQTVHSELPAAVEPPAAIESRAEIRPVGTVLPPPPGATDAALQPQSRNRLEPGATGPAEPVAASRKAEEGRSGADWETLLGGNWLNKIGAFVLVVGIALALGYSFAHMGPAGRAATGLAVSLTLLGSGVFYERRPSYRIFSRGLIGGGWAALYITAYAMHALPAARIVNSQVGGAMLLMAVAAGMILHALRYRSEAVAAVAYFSAFVALGITEVTSFSVIALVPLAASLLYLARRFQWMRLALFNVVATYLTCASRGDSGASLWATQAILATYWLLFEGFDIIAPTSWAMPLNALGFLWLSLFKWQAADSAHLWLFLAAAALVYAASAILRARTRPKAAPLAGGWHGPAALSAALGAAAIFQRLDHWQLLLALLAEAELLYLCGLRLGARFLRHLGAPLFAIALIHMTVVEVGDFPVHYWAPLAILTAAVFYLNRVLCAEDKLYGFGAAAVAALVAGYESPARECGRTWFLLASIPFFLGWRLRLPDFRLQGYLLACLAIVGTAVTAPHPPLSTAIGTAVSFGMAAFALRSNQDRFLPREGDLLFNAASTAGAVGAALLIRAIMPPPPTGPGWAALALALVFAAQFISRSAQTWHACALAAAAFVQCTAVNLWNHDGAFGAALAVVCLYAAQLAMPRGRGQRVYYSLLGSGLLGALLYYEVSGSVLTVAWGVEGLGLLAAGFPLRDRILRLSGLALLLFCILKLFIYDLSSLDTLPRIFSFIVLGLILVGVSWIYTRFRDRVQRYL